MTIKVGDVIERRYHVDSKTGCVWLPQRVTMTWRDAIYYGDCYVLLRDEGLTWRRAEAKDATK